MLTKEEEERGIDYDLGACLTHNPQDGFDEDDIEKVLAVWEGQNDGDDWRWILALKDGRYVFLKGGCDYTGWDCKSYAESVFALSPMEALDSIPYLGEIRTRQDVYDSLYEQLRIGKNTTWREETTKEFSSETVSISDAVRTSKQPRIEVQYMSKEDVIRNVNPLDIIEIPDFGVFFRQEYSHDENGFYYDLRDTKPRVTRSIVRGSISIVSSPKDNGINNYFYVNVHGWSENESIGVNWFLWEYFSKWFYEGSEAHVTRLDYSKLKFTLPRDSKTVLISEL